MGLTIQATEFIIDKLILLITYFTVIPVIGYFRAWVAEKMGDDTPEKMGFLSFNPLVHISYMWLLLILIDMTSFGFGCYIPLDPSNFQGRGSVFRMLAAYLSDAFANIIIALVALFCFVLFFGSSPLEFFVSFSHARTAALYSGYETTSSFAIVVALFLRNVVFFNSLLAGFNIILNLFYAGCFYFYSRKRENTGGRVGFGQVLSGGGDHMQWIMFVVPLILLLFFAKFVQFWILSLVLTIGTWFWHCISLLS